MIIRLHIRSRLRHSVGLRLRGGVGLSRLPLGRLVGLLGAVVLVLDQQPQRFGGLGRNAESAGSPRPH
jgi:hypothetical protein